VTPPGPAPRWGDLADLLEVVDVKPMGDGRYGGASRSNPQRPVVEGSQILGQAVVAAGREAPGRRVVSAHLVFCRVASTEAPLELALTPVTSGRTMTTLRVDARQDGRVCATGTLLADVTAPDVMRHSEAPPAVAPPYQCPPYDMGVDGREVRVVDGAYGDDPDAPPGPPVIDCWVRFDPLPPDPHLHAGLLAHFSGHMSIAAAMRPHPGIGQSLAHRSLSTGVNALSLSFHAPVRADRWMLYHHRSTFAGDGMTRSECRVFDEEGRLLASFSADCMVRAANDAGRRPEALRL
jgi:acyl-CoA thioesterase-2